MDSTGQVTPARIASVSSPQDDESDASLNSRFASALVSMTQPTQSSYCLLECGSGSSSAKKNSANPRQSRSQLCRVSLAQPSSVPGSVSKS
jgi:hypothetical protein